MSCIIEIKDSKIYKPLKRRFGNNETKIYTLWNHVIKGEEFTPEFQKWQQAKRHTNKPVTLDTIDTRTIVNDIVEFYNITKPDGNDTVLDKKDNAAANYGSVADRRFCKRIVGSEMLDIFRDEHYGKHNPNPLTREQYINAVRNEFANRLLKRLGMTNDDIKPRINMQRLVGLMSAYLKNGETKAVAQSLALKAEYINITRDILGKDISDQDANFLATFEEMINSNKNKVGDKISDNFFDEVFSDNRLSEIRDDLKDEFYSAEDDAQNNEDVELGEDTSEDENSIKDSYDVSFRVFDSHDGQYSTFTTHIGGNIRSYLNSLRRCYGTGTVKNSDGKEEYSYNTDNAIGIADTMNANECAMILYTQGSYVNVPTMIESIRRIANTVPGFESFVILADDLDNNYDFAYEFYRTFGKMVISKTETYIEDGERKTRIINNTANKIDALRFEYQNALRSSAAGVVSEEILDSVSKLKNDVSNISKWLKNSEKFISKDNIVRYDKNFDTYKTDKLDFVASAVKLLKSYIPNIDASTIIRFIENNTKNGVVDEVFNMSTLCNHIEALAKGAYDTKLNYISKTAESARIGRENKPIIEAIANASPEEGFILSSKLQDTNAIWAEDLLTTKGKEAAIQLADLLVNYTTVKTELNSRNSKGNLSSDVINSSMITNLMNILQSDLNTEDNLESPIRNYTAYKFRTKQYNLSNILVEKVKNKITINKGLFRLVNGQYVPTEYAKDLIRMSLFNGISDFGSGKSALYANMSQGDYVTTAMINFFNSTHKTKNIIFADYMMRIPSDAPKNFIFTAPRYSLEHKEGNRTISFWQIENEELVNRRVQELINNLPHKNAEDYDEVSLNDYEVSVDDAVKLITNNYKDSLKLDSKKSALVRPNKSSKEAYLTVKVGSTQFIVKGTLNESNTELSNVKLHGLINNYYNNVAFNSDLNTELKDYYKTQLIKGKLKMADGSTVNRKINRQHPIFQQLFAVFQQEAQNAATAVDKIFSHVNGRILFDDKGNPIYSAKFAQLSDKDRATYANYHRKDNEYIDKDGNKHKETGIIQNVWLPVYDKEGKIKYWEKTNKKRLSGNVFTSDRFTIFDEDNKIKRNFLQEVFSEDEATSNDGKLHIFYGGANAQLNCHLNINANGEVEFTKSQQELIENKIEEFINAYVKDSVERIDKFKNFLEGTPHKEDDIAEFMLNYHLAYINCNDLFEGDSKFYKSTQDFLKRAKETQGSGVPYGIVDITRPMFGEINVEVKNSYLNSPEMQNIVGSLHNCKQFTTFKAVTVKNTIRTSAESQGILVEQLTKNFIKEGLNSDVARKKAEAMMNGYKNTKVNDAQSYITFEEWIRRVSARGQLHKYKPLIEAILDESKPLDVSDINEFIQVQKNFYYDMVYNELTGVMAPRQIKNAEFVLVPRLIRGTELEQVYNTMIKNGIDQLNTEETSKAGKANVLTLWDNDGNIAKEWTEDLSTLSEEEQSNFSASLKQATEVFSYNYLYTQQETPQHLNAENKAGIQIMKKILDNIDENSSPKLQEAKARFFKNYSQNIYESSIELLKELNVSIDENGNILIDENGRIKGLDYKVITDKLKEEMMRLGLDSNMIDFVTLVDTPLEDKVGDNGFGLPTKMTPILNINRKKLESISQAIFNNAITRQKLPGFHAAQITQIGFKPFRNKVQNVSYAQQLRYHPNGERYIEVMLPASAFGLNRNDAIWNDIRKKYEADGLSTEEIEAKIDSHMLNYLKSKECDTVIGYRIPTEGKQSVCVMKVVGFTPDAYGSTIVVPDDWVAQTGSDFDIDSIYGIQYSVRRNDDGSFEKIKYSTDPEKNYISYVLRSLEKDNREELLRAKQSEKFVLAEQIAKEHDFMSFEDYSKLDISEQNSREARNNQILDDMITILQSDEALEENLSQSQFGDIIDSRDDIIAEVDAARRNARSPYNFLDQAEYQEDAMSGAKLKAFSVTLDTFCSICNTVKPVFSSPIEIVYTGNAAKFKELQKRFDKKENDDWVGNVVQLDDKHILVKHTGLGYSNDNKNVVGKILTAYSSQTTAHILDAIKEGAIKNVNDLTFGVYKLFPNIGSDYKTAISFMMQPGVTEVVNAYNRNKSIYSKTYENPTNSAIRSIAKQLGLKTDKASIQFIESKLDELVKANGMQKINVLNGERLTERIKDIGDFFSSPVRKLLFDYLVVKKYKELSDIAGKIGALTRVCNPDKFGAKQTIFETNKVFDDILDILSDENPVFGKTNNKSFLESIYPGISKIKTDGIEGYLENKDNDSAYPPLHNFLKYATATSIKINRTLFVTQHPKFVQAVKEIQKVISGSNPRLKENTYNAFERYILCDIYRKVPIIANPIVYSYKTGIDYIKVVDYSKERERIFGYGYNPDLKTVDKNGNIVDFNPINKLHPTKDEIEMFIKLTPAQKVWYIQQNFSDGLICKYLKTNLVNNKEYRRNKSGAQTIEFIEDNTDIETIYSEFYNTFANKNPLLALTAMDIIKYAFVVEGYNMKKHAVTKVIDNDILINDKGFDGTGINKSLSDTVGNFANHPDFDRVRQLTESFVRSHSTMSEISHTYIGKKDLNKFNRLNNGFLIITENETTNEFLVEHGIGYNVKSNNETKFIPNRYVKINFGKGKETLYKITGSNFSDVIYLSPLNLLEEAETGEWSSNMSNNVFPPAKYYTDCIDKYDEHHEVWSGEEFIKLQKELSKNKEYKKPERVITKYESIEPVDDWDINDTTVSGIVRIKDAILDHFNGTTSQMLIIESSFLQDKIKGFGIENGIRKVVNGNAYYIYRLNTKHSSTVAGNEGSKLFDYTSKQGLNREILPEDKPFEELIKRARQRGIDAGHPGEAHINFAYAIVPATNSDSYRNASLTETMAKSDKSIRRRARNDESLDPERYVEQMSKRSIESNRKSIKTNEEDVLIAQAEFVTASVDKILNGENGLNLFCEDPDNGGYLKITDSKVLDLIRQSPVLRRKYLRTILKAKHLIDTFESFSIVKYADDEQNFKYYIDKINAEIKKLSESPILQEAEELYVTGYLAKITNNPNIANNIVSLLDGYHTTSFLGSWINDLQDTSNPIIQIITSDVMSDIRAKEFQGEQRARDFRKFIKYIKDKAAKNGHTIDWKHLIDEYGKWINDYNDQFIEDLENLRSAKDDAYVAYKNAATDYDKAVAYEQYLQRKLEYDKWKLENVNQEIVDDYYRQHIELEESMINTDTGRFADIYVELQMLYDKLGNINSLANSNGVLDAHYEQEKKDILSAIANLKSDAIRTAEGDYIQKRDLEQYEISSDPVIRRNQNINSLSSAIRLRKFIEKRNALNDEYYTRTERFGFQEQVKKYVSLVKKYENSGRTEDELYNIPEYANAKNWLKRNAYFQYNLYNDESINLTEQEIDGLLEDYYNGTYNEETLEFPKRVKAAIEYLKNNRGSRSNRNAVYKRIAKQYDARDEYGVIDARMFTPGDIAAIKAEQEARYGIGESVPYSERGIIHSSTTDDTIYTSEFYQGMNVGGLSNPQYLKVVKDINDILRRVINPSTGVLETSKLSVEEINAVLEQFSKLGYDKTEQTFNTSNGPVKHTGVKRRDVLAVKEFIDKNVEFVLSEEDQRRFEAEKYNAYKFQEEHGGTYYLAWCELNQEWSEEKQQFVPNHLLWGHAQPKSTLPKAERDRFISKKKTAAIRILNKVFTERPTKYYQMEKSKMIDTYGVNSPEFKKWEEDNHIYNPHTHKYEPLVCWTTSEPNDNMPGKWEPSYQMTDRGVKHANDDYNKGLGHAANYKNNGNKYQRINNLNEEEKELKLYIQKLLSQLATTKKARRYIEQGNLPTKALKESKSAAKLWLTELAKGFGWVENSLGTNTWNSDTEATYDTDYIPDMPMLQQLVSKDTHRPPYREAYNSTEEYEKAKEEYEKHKKEYDKKNREIHKNLIDNNWEEVIAEFIIKAAHYNAVQDNKYQLYFGQKLINDIQIYQSRLSNPNHLVKDSSLTTDEETVYKKKVDTNLQDQYTNWVRRVIFDEYKKNQGKKTRIMQVLQSVTSVNYMTLNLRGGIANILVGETNIWGEMWAKEYFGTKDWLIGKQIWLSGLSSFAANMYKDTSTTLADAIIKAFNVVDYDENTGRVSVVDAEEWSKRIRDAAFSPQTIGEHFMQNGAMFSMMMSHRVVSNPKFGQPGEPRYVFMNKEEYISHNRELALPEDEIQNYHNFIESIKEDADKVKDYAQFRADAITRFVTTRLSKDKQKAFIEKEKQIRTEAEKTFTENPTVYSQFKLGEDGKLDFADDSLLAQMNELTGDQEVTDAYKFMGKFKGRVISANKKIHGNYGKLDAARLESEWFGGLLMQYHKHLYPGIMKRWRRQGYWNEERGTVEKGSYVALYDFLTAPIKQIAERNALSDGQTQALISVQKMFGVIADYLHFAKLNYEIMPEYERANMRRVLGDIAGMAVAVMGAVLLRLGYDDDDDSIAYNLGLYEMDRLATEAFMWNPIGLYAEGKKLWSSPVAAQSIVGDIFNILGTTSGILLQGEDYDPYFHGGRYNGQYKLGVYVERRIPYWRNWVAIRDIADNNHYYKMGDNLTSWLGVDEINK